MRHTGLQFLLPYMRPYHRLLWFGVLYALIGAGASAFSPTWLGWGVDALLRGVQPRVLLLYSLGLIGLSMTLAIFRYMLRMLTGEIAAGVSYHMSKDLFHHITNFDQQTRQEFGTGDLLSRATNDFIYIWRFYSAGFQMSMHSLILLVIGCALMAITSPLLAAVVVGLFSLSVLAQLYLGGILEQSFIQVEREMARISAFAQEHLSAARMLTAYDQKRSVGQAFRNANQEYVQRNMRFVLQSGAISPIPSLMVRLAATIVVLLGGSLVIRNQLTVGQYVQFIVYLNLLNNATRQVTGAFERLQQGSAAAMRVGEVLSRQPHIQDAASAEEPAFTGAIRFENIGVWSAEQQRWVLRGINLQIPAGSTLGVVGPTGSGKSFLINLLGRLVDPSEGAVYLDGHDLRVLKLAALRRAIAYVPQETLLFSLPLRKNITLGLSDTRHAAVDLSIRQARLSNDLAQLPAGLDSMVGERGMTLSGGQKQRTALARALVRAPKVLILDDALASIDMKTAAEIVQELRQAENHATCLIVSQRMAAIQHADQIIVLNEGRIVEQGDHDSLMACNGRYAAMVRREAEQAEKSLIL
jgi:ATP-binding cassette subfamily B protein